MGVVQATVQADGNADCVPATMGPARVFDPDPTLTQSPRPQRDMTLRYKKTGGQQGPPGTSGRAFRPDTVSDQLLSATSTSSSIFLASPNSMRLLSL